MKRLITDLIASLTMIAMVLHGFGVIPEDVSKLIAEFQPHIEAIAIAVIAFVAGRSQDLKGDHG